MSYNYREVREELFTDEGQRLFLAIRDQVKGMLENSGAVTMDMASRMPKKIGAADSFLMQACIDRMVELGELVEVGKSEKHGYNRVFVELN